MQFITKKHLDRRTLLRGIGAAVGLPLLDAMVPALAVPGPTQSPLRLSFAYVPNGMVMDHFTPATFGRDFDLPRILQPLRAVRDDLLVLSGLDHHNANALGDGGGDHARAGATYLTGVHCKKTMGADIENGVSADQIAARAVGSQTRIASLELSCEDPRMVGNCDSGYSCAYTNSISWRTPTTPNPPETNPRLVFERLFGGLAAGSDPKERAEIAAERESVLDLVQGKAKQLSRDLGAGDRRKLDEYFTAVRDIEQRIQRAEDSNRPVTAELEPPVGVPSSYSEFVKLMYDLQVAAFAADLTRVVTMLYSREASAQAYPEIGIKDGHHPISHHRNNPELLEKLTQINQFHVSLLAYFLEKLKATQDGDGSLLDHSFVVYGCAIADSNRHIHEKLPALVAGRGGGTIKTGSHMAFPDGTPMTNLFVTLLNHMGVPAQSLGDSSGTLSNLDL